MSVDMSQFHGVFFEESQEHINEMENLLMNIDLAAPDAEELNSIFRAAHSIKGGSGIFGFDALTGLTHIMENLLDKARKNQLSLTTTIVDALLSTVDILQAILDAYRNSTDIDWASIERGTQKLEKIANPQQQKNNKEEEEDEGFGFFHDNIQTADEEGFGFFNDNEGINENFADGFGFFDEDFNDDDENETVELVQEENPNSVQTEQKEIDKPASTNVTKDSSTIRVDTVKIDSLVNLVGELVITQSMLTNISTQVNGAVEEKLTSAVEELSRNVREIQEAVMSMRMLPISFAFNRFPRVVRDLANKMEKKVNLEIKGGNTEIDKGMIEKIVDPLTHLVRNSVDHGIEMPQERAEKGKPATGTVTLTAEQKGGAIFISIEDDGAGLNRDTLLAKAKSNGLNVDDNFTDEQVWNLIFAPGFSTAKQVTDVSGRGVGMDVVKRNITSIGGNVYIDSIEGKGSKFTIHLPLTLAIVDGMCVACSDQVFIIPLTHVVESIQPTPDQLKLMANERLLWIREEYWPIIALHEFMEIEDAITDPTQAVIVLVESNNRRFGLLVDGLVGQQQVVVKSLEQHYKKVPGVGGATILGDGSVALILDIELLAPSIKSTTKIIEVPLVKH